MRYAWQAQNLAAKGVTTMRSHFRSGWPGVASRAARSWEEPMISVSRWSKTRFTCMTFRPRFSIASAWTTHGWRIAIRAEICDSRMSTVTSSKRCWPKRLQPLAELDTFRLRQEAEHECFLSLLLVTCPHLLLTKALILDLEPTRIGMPNSALTYCDLNLYTNSTNTQ